MTTERKYFDKEKIKDMLHHIGAALPTKTRVLLIGGGAMSLKGDKNATKDIDMAVIDRMEFFGLYKTLIKMGFKPLMEFSRKMNDLIDTEDIRNPIMINNEGFHIDLFLETVCRRFHIDDRFFDSAILYHKFNKLEVHLLSDEGIFLAKSVTERDKDLDDMILLYRKGLDVEALINEMKRQTGLSRGTTIWSAFMVKKLDELEEKFDFTVPWKKRVEQIAIHEIEEMIGKNEPSPGT